MVVLSRKRGEHIVIGDSIEVTVVSIRGRRVHLAVNAPRDVRVNRGEIHHRIVEEEHNNAMDAESRTTGPKSKLLSQESQTAQRPTNCSYNRP